MTDHNVVRMMGNNSSVRDQESLVEQGRKADNSMYGYVKEGKAPWARIDGDRRPSKKRVSEQIRNKRSTKRNYQKARARSWRRFTQEVMSLYSAKTNGRG